MCYKNEFLSQNIHWGIHVSFTAFTFHLSFFLHSTKLLLCFFTFSWLTKIHRFWQNKLTNFLARIEQNLQHIIHQQFPMKIRLVTSIHSQEQTRAKKCQGGQGFGMIQGVYRCVLIYGKVVVRHRHDLQRPEEALFLAWHTTLGSSLSAINHGGASNRTGCTNDMKVYSVMLQQEIYQALLL